MGLSSLKSHFLKNKNAYRRVATGAGAGSGLGAAGGAVAYEKDPKKSKAENAKSRKRWALAGAISGGAIGGMQGFGYHKQKAFHENMRDSRRQWEDHFRQGRHSGSGGRNNDWSGFGHYKPDHGPHLKHLNLHGKEKTKMEVKRAYREAAKKAHPDMGGSEEKMKHVNNAYDNIQKSDWFDKLASGFTYGFQSVVG